MPELLMPAGNLNKLKTAFHFGADAVYAGAKSLSLRAFAGNFDDDELALGVKYAHDLRKKVYVTANVAARDADFEEAARLFELLASIGADGVLVSDLGMLSLAKEVAPSLPIHISTQANVTNAKAAEMYAKLGAKRIVLARELSLADVAVIHAALPELQLEAFVHGAMCISYSGRCLLSSYLAGRSGNRGECAQPCRWQYTLKEADTPGELGIEEDKRGTYILNSKDLCLIKRLAELENAGVCSFKVEGRMKSEFYIATVANAYRKAMDELEAYGALKCPETYLAALDGVSHRPYTEAFFDGDNLDTVSHYVGRIEEKFKFVAQVLDCKDGVVTVEMRNRFKTGDTLTVLSTTQANGKQLTVGPIRLLKDDSLTDDALLVQAAYSFACPYPLAVGDLLVRRLA